MQAYTIYTAEFANGERIAKTSKEGIESRLDFYNWICRNKIGKENGKLIEIRCTPAR